MSYHADKLMIDARTDTHTDTDAGNDNTRRPKLDSGKNRKTNRIKDWFKAKIEKESN